VKINLIALTTLLVAALTARAQYNDRVITVTGDTIACQINLPVFGAPKYRTSENEKAKKIKTDSVKEYYTEDKSIWFRKVLRVRNKVYFMSVVESGKINLYELITDYNNVPITGWYASKGTDTVILIKEAGLAGNRKRHDFEALIADNKAVYEKYTADDKFSFDEIRNLIHLYNASFNNPGKPKDPD
jgi:hypothetical protein